MTIINFIDNDNSRVYDIISIIVISIRMYVDNCSRSGNPKKKKKTKTDNKSNQVNDDETQTSSAETKGKMSRIQEVMEANEELKNKIKEKEDEIQQLRRSSDKHAEDLSKDLQMIETEIEIFVNKIKYNEEGIRNFLAPNQAEEERRETSYI